MEWWTDGMIEWWTDGMIEWWIDGIWHIITDEVVNESQEFQSWFQFGLGYGWNKDHMEPGLVCCRLFWWPNVPASFWGVMFSVIWSLQSWPLHPLPPRPPPVLAYMLSSYYLLSKAMIAAMIQSNVSSQASQQPKSSRPGWGDWWGQAHLSDARPGLVSPVAHGFMDPMEGCLCFFFRKEVNPKSSNNGNIGHFVSKEHQWFWVFHTILWNTHIIDISLVSSILLSMFGLWRRSQIQWGCVRFEKIDIQQHFSTDQV